MFRLQEGMSDGEDSLKYESIDVSGRVEECGEVMNAFGIVDCLENN